MLAMGDTALQGQIALVTGAGSGLGTAIAGEPVEPVRCFSSLTDEQFDRMMRTHVYGTFNGMRAALRHMETARSGAIVNLCSIYSYGGSVATPEYAAAKHAIAGMTKSVGAEVAPLG